jgi:hypothetical protein
MMIYFCVKFQKDPQFGVNLTFVAPWLPTKIGIGWTYFDAVAMETKKGDLIFWGISLIKLHEAL